MEDVGARGAPASLPPKESTVAVCTPEFSETTKEALPAKKGAVFLLLFSGPKDRPDSIASCLSELTGIQCDSFDVINGSEGDVADDYVWDDIVAKLDSSFYCGVFASPPCSTFSKLRSIPGGPPVLRDPSGPGRYGRSDLSASQKQMVRLHNLLALRACYALKAMVKQGKPFVYENPQHNLGEVSMLTLDEYVDLMADPSVSHCVGVQCPFGGAAAKRTSWVTSLVNFADMPAKCSHSLTSWYSSVDNTRIVARHAPTRGKIRYLREPVPLDRRGSGPDTYISAGLAVYPTLLNKYIAAKLALVINSPSKTTLHRPCRRSVLACPGGGVGSSSSGGSSLRDGPSSLVASVPVDSRFDAERIQWKESLRGQQSLDQRVRENDLAVGGLRDAHKSVTRLSQTAAFGLQLGGRIRKLLVDNLDACNR